MKILYADDDDLFRQLTKMALEMDGIFKVCDYCSGADAVCHANDVKPDLILLDMMMPGMTGLETLTKLRQITAFSQTPAIFITSSLKSEEIEAYYDHQAIGIIPKPFDMLTLSDEVLSLWNANKIVSNYFQTGI